jgi:hypothetical protein
MTQPNLRELLRRLLADDEQLYTQLCASGLLPAEDAALQPEHLETARVVRTLVQELEINWPGVEVIVRMRAQLVATQRQVAELAELVRQLQERER